MAAYYHESGDTVALGLAKQAFHWLDGHAHDTQYKGYFQHLNRDGSVIIRDASVPSTSDLGYKDQNSSIHLLEAFTELYNVWKDDLLRSRLQEMLLLVRDVMMTKQGYLQLFFIQIGRMFLLGIQMKHRYCNTVISIMFLLVTMWRRHT